MLMSASAGQIGGAGPAGLSVPLLGAIAVIAVLAWPAARRRTTASAAMLGALAGFAYAIVGIAGRLLPGWALGRLLSSPMAYVLLLSGLLAFFFYTLALQRGAVTVVTTPLIVAQTVMPSLVGLLLLGDGVRPHWWGVGGAGFVLTVTAATALVRFEEAAI